jgi:hypothetical protein
MMIKIIFQNATIQIQRLIISVQFFTIFIIEYFCIVNIIPNVSILKTVNKNIYKYYIDDF